MIALKLKQFAFLNNTQIEQLDLKATKRLKFNHKKIYSRTFYLIFFCAERSSKLLLYFCNIEKEHLIKVNIWKNGFLDRG